MVAPAVSLPGFLRLPQVLALVPVSKSTLWRHVSAGRFPAPVKLFVGVTAWRVDDVRSWIEERGDANLGFEREGLRRRILTFARRDHLGHFSEPASPKSRLSLTDAAGMR
ncbi:MAG: AlpA family phage regulatory protein [Burkholderiaceae bacterium]